MKAIEIGKQFSASAISLGCMRMGALDEARVDAIMDTALSCGINFFDHADIYGKGNAESDNLGVWTFRRRLQEFFQSDRQGEVKEIQLHWSGI